MEWNNGMEWNACDSGDVYAPASLSFRLDNFRVSCTGFRGVQTCALFGGMFRSRTMSPPTGSCRKKPTAKVIYVAKRVPKVVAKRMKNGTSNTAD
jgi:hypothetical protein